MIATWPATRICRRMPPMHDGHLAGNSNLQTNASLCTSIPFMVMSAKGGLLFVSPCPHKLMVLQPKRQHPTKQTHITMVPAPNCNTLTIFDGSIPLSSIMISIFSYDCCPSTEDWPLLGMTIAMSPSSCGFEAEKKKHGSTSTMFDKVTSQSWLRMDCVKINTCKYIHASNNAMDEDEQ